MRVLAELIGAIIFGGALFFGISQMVKTYIKGLSAPDEKAPEEAKPESTMKRKK